MFRNKIGRSQTNLYSIFYQKATGVLQHPVATEGIWLVWHSTNLATVYSWVTVGNCLMEYEYKLLRQFTMTVGRTGCYLWFKQSHSNSLHGHTKHFYSYLRIELSGSSWKAPGYFNNGKLKNSKTQKLGSWITNDDLRYVNWQEVEKAL